METRKIREKVLLVIIDVYKKNDLWTPDEVRKEMEELVKACHGEVVDSIVCRINKFYPSNLIGDGKVQDIISLNAVKDFNTVIFSHDLKGSQQRNIEEKINLKTIDRTQLILDIFSRRAKSKEGKMQVELAQLEYLLPRLVGKGIELSRLGGGIGTLGPGETKLEVDRRRIGQRIDKLKKDLREVSQNRAIKRKKRKETGVPTVSLIGYTNAGKSTLLNTLTQAEQTTRDGLFTTLDPLSRQLVLPNHQKVVLSDTVGFMHELPHRLIESFKATLEEVIDADLLLHVLDISNPQFRKLQESVVQVLAELESQNKTIVTVLNKIDQVQDKKSLDDLKNIYKPAVCVSAKTGENLDELCKLITSYLADLYVEIDTHIPIQRMDLVNLVHKEGEVYAVKYYDKTIHIRASVPSQIAGKIKAAE